MKHLGDITKINGAEIEPVDCIIGGSPCQDLSVAGKRAGLEGNRSSLFMEQIRVIKEMREHDKITRGTTGNDIRPRFMVWENVPGAISSNNGEDFRTVLEEIARVADPNAIIPRLNIGEKWTPSGTILGKGFSLSWRIHDAQYWGKSVINSDTGNVFRCGTPQRRSRLSLVADFGGETAPQIQFESKGVSRSPKSVKQTREATSQNTSNCTGTTDTTSCLNSWDIQSKRIHGENGVAGTLYSGERRYGGGESYVLQKLNTFPNQSTTDVIAIEGNGTRKSHNGNGYSEDGVSYTLNTVEHHAVAIKKVFDISRRHDYPEFDKVSETVQASYGMGGNNTPVVVENAPQATHSEKNSVAITLDEKMGRAYIGYDIGNTLSARDYKQPQAVVYQNVVSALCADDYKGSNNTYVDQDKCIISEIENCRYIVRRLTPLECERLQGFPDGWTDISDWTDTKGKLHKSSLDSHRYKALGNSIALPFWKWLCKRISDQYDRPATMGSLFDGIGGFDVCWALANGKENIRWSSEIEEFPIAVVKKHFGDEDTGLEGDFDKYLQEWNNNEST